MMMIVPSLPATSAHSNVMMPLPPWPSHLIQMQLRWITLCKPRPSKYKKEYVVSDTGITATIIVPSTNFIINAGPSGGFMHSTHTSGFLISLLKQSKEAQIMPQLKHTSLMSDKKWLMQDALSPLMTKNAKLCFKQTSVDQIIWSCIGTLDYASQPVPTVHIQTVMANYVYQ